MYARERKTGRLMLIILMMSIVSLSFAQFEGGDGSEHAPWRINTAEHLNNIRFHTGAGYAGKYFIQTADIDLGVPPWNEDGGWEPIPNFNGNYDGFNRQISNLTIQRETTRFLGLFGECTGATIQRLHLTGVEIIANDYNFSGGLVGSATRTIISNVSVEGQISGRRWVGGIAGGLFENSRLINCYTVGEIIGTQSIASIGGLVGYNYLSNITNCYSVCYIAGRGLEGGGLVGTHTGGTLDNSYAVTIFAEGHNITRTGGLAGRAVEGTVRNSFWNREVSLINESPGGGIGLETEAMMSRAIYREAGWVFPLVWDIDENESYPYFSWQQEPGNHNRPGPYNLWASIDPDNRQITLNWEMPGTPDRYLIIRNGYRIAVVNHPVREWIDRHIESARSYTYYVVAVYDEDGVESESMRSGVIKSGIFPFAGGTGTAEDPYLVASAQQLSMIKDLLDKHFVQIADIDLSELPGDWQPLGSVPQADRFTGSYDGNGYVISNLTVSGGSYRGLFREVENAVLRNIVIRDIRVYGQSYVGALAGRINNSIIENCDVSGGIVSGSSNYVGGLAGSISGTVTNCRTDVRLRVLGSHGGGLVGSFSGEISNSYALGDINITGTGSSSFFGGFIGLNQGEINNCFYSGTVATENNSKRHIGGLCGRSEGDIHNSFALGQVIGGNITGGLTGSFTGTAITISYAAVNVTGIENVGGLIGSNEARIVYSYAVGIVRGENRVGGLIGENSGDVEHSFWSIDVSGQDESAGGVGLSLEDMLRIESYRDWDFDDDWTIIDGLTFPYLVWQDRANKYNIPPPFNLAAESDNEIQEVTLSWDVINAPARYNIYRNDILLGTIDTQERLYIDRDVPLMFHFSYTVTAVYEIEEDEVETNPSNIAAVYFRASFPDGSGTEEDPYQVNSPETLMLIKEHLSAHFIQIDDIDLDVYPWNYGDGWNPIGTSETPFRGSYNGNEQIISGMTIQQSAQSRNNRALFGYTGANAVVKNLGMLDVNIEGNQYLAGIVAQAGRNNIISNCFVTGNITSRGYMGGIVAVAQPGTRITDCYSGVALITGATGTVFVGGIIAYSNDCFIERCYATGKIEMTVSSNFAGAVVGRQIQGALADLYWNTDTTGHNRAVGNEIGFPGNNTIEFVRQATFEGFDFDEVWRIDEDRSYPYLRWQGDTSGRHNRPSLPPVGLRGEQNEETVILSWNPPEFVDDDLIGYNIYRDNVKINQDIVAALQYIDTGLQLWSAYIYYVTAVYEIAESVSCPHISVATLAFAGGEGTEENPWLVTSAEQLNGMRLTSNAHFRQAADIDLAQYNESGGWVPIGDVFNKFTTYYDGGNHVITNLLIDRSRAFQGLFGYTSGAVLKNIALTGVSIRGVLYVGGLVGTASSTQISNCLVEGHIRGVSYVGGLAGSISDESDVRFCYASGKVTSDQQDLSIVGGLIGASNNGIITDSFSKAAVTGYKNYIGGLVGSASVTYIHRCYHSGLVKAVHETPEYIGGLVGSPPSGEIIDCYWNIETSKQTASEGGGVGRNTEQMTYPYDADTFVNWDFTDVWAADIDFKNDGYPLLQRMAYVSVEDETILLPEQLSLTNYPNPFNPDTKIEFSLPYETEVRLIIFNSRGQRIKSLHNSYTEAGKHSIIWNGQDDRGVSVPSGVYLYRLITNKETITRKMMMIK